MLNTNTFNQDPIGKHSGLRQRIAHLTSNIFNPFFLCLGLIIHFSIISSSSTSEAFKWVGISVGLGLMPVLLVILYLMRNGKLDDFFIAAREQRTKIYAIGTLSAGAGCVTLLMLDAPSILVASFITAISTAIIFALINLWWKISLHAALAAAFPTILIVLYGWAIAWTMVLIPLTAWARIELDAHSFKQTVFGAVLASLLVLVLFEPLSMIS